MKTKIILFLCAMSLVIQAQNYKSYFGESFNKWYILYDGNTCPNTFCYLTTKGDTTTIDSKTYHYLYEIHEGRNDTVNSVPSGMTSNYLLREDHANGRLYYRYKIYSSSSSSESLSQEEIVSDMSLQVGDSIPVSVTTTNLTFWNNLRFSAVKNKYYAIVDSVYTKDGLKHIRTSALFKSQPSLFGSANIPLTFIEGIGSNLSPILDYGIYAYMSDVWKLMCNMQTNSNQYYNSQRLMRLYLICDTDRLNETVKNPVYTHVIKNGYIKLKFNSNFSGMIRLITTTGIPTAEYKVSNNTEYDINCTTLKIGIYLLQTISSTGKMETTKLILQ